jgi:hypothetical protein
MVVHIFAVHRGIDLRDLFTLALAYADPAFSDDFFCKGDEYNVKSKDEKRKTKIWAALKLYRYFRFSLFVFRFSTIITLPTTR